MTEPRTEGVRGSGRRIFVALLVIAATGGLLWRSVDLQLNHNTFLKQQGDARHLRVVKVTAHRGQLLDRNGEPLAISTPVDSIWANPGELRPGDPGWRTLVELLGLDGERVAQTLAQRRDREFVYLKRHVGVD